MLTYLQRIPPNACMQDMTQAQKPHHACMAIHYHGVTSVHDMQACSRKGFHWQSRGHTTTGNVVNAAPIAAFSMHFFSLTCACSCSIGDVLVLCRACNAHKQQTAHCSKLISSPNHLPLARDTEVTDQPKVHNHKHSWL